MTLGLPLRASAAVLAGIAVDVGCWRAVADDRHAALAPGATLGDLLTGLAGLVLCLALTWGVLLLALVAAEPLSGRDLAGALGCPARLRPALLMLSGVAVAGAVAAGTGAAGAAPAQPAPYDGARDAPVVAGGVLDGRLDGLSLPERPLGSVRHPTTTVVVRPGDCLWSIARDRLGDADAWRAIHALNADVIGPDPDLLLPGVRLRLPTTLEEDR
ncbi:MAG: hypothetical protein JWO46_294 [Nocardioidaceae bacterium]|nr:hypothetical protein [Nocardioidaceae bacterium]